MRPPTSLHAIVRAETGVGSFRHSGGRARAPILDPAAAEAQLRSVPHGHGMSSRSADCHSTSAGLVYVVDGDPDVRARVRSLLAPLGAEVRAFATAAEVLAGIAQSRPSCLIADAHLSDLGGLELLSALRERALRVPTILLSRDDDVALAVAAMRAGAVDFIEKPFVERALLNQVAPLLGLDDRAG